MDAQEARAVLGVGPRAGPGEIRAAYRRLALEFHPDKGSRDGGRMFRAVREAYDALRGGADQGAGPRGRGQSEHAPGSGPRRGRGPLDITMDAAADSARRGANGGGAPPAIEYGLAPGATSWDGLVNSRRARLFRLRPSVEVETLSARRRDDAALAGQTLLRIAAERSGLRSRGRCVSGGLLVRENGGPWMWVTRLEVTV